MLGTCTGVDIVCVSLSHSFVLVPVVGALRGSVVPSLRSLMSKMVNENDHGLVVLFLIASWLPC